MLIFVVFSLMWSLSSCGVIGIRESQQNYDDDDSNWPYNFQNYPSRSFDRGASDKMRWIRLQVYRRKMKDYLWHKEKDATDMLDTPTEIIDTISNTESNKIRYNPGNAIEWDEATTARATLYNRFTVPDWVKLTDTPFKWNKYYSIKPIDWNDYHFTMKPIKIVPVKFRSTKEIKWALCIPIVFVAALIALCKHFICKAKRTTDSGLTSMIIIARSRTEPNETPDLLQADNPPPPVTTIAQDATSDSVNCGVDKPPDYSTVVGGLFNFPRTVPDSPPPKYEEGKVNVV